MYSQTCLMRLQGKTGFGSHKTGGLGYRFDFDIWYKGGVKIMVTYTGSRYIEVVARTVLTVYTPNFVISVMTCAP